MAFITQAGEPGSWHVRDLGCLGCPRLALGNYQERRNDYPAIGLLPCCVTRAYNEHDGCPPAAERSETLAEQRRLWGYSITADEGKRTTPLYVIDDDRLARYHSRAEVLENLRVLAELLNRAGPLTTYEVHRATGLNRGTTTKASSAGLIEKAKSGGGSMGWVLTELGRKKLLPHEGESDG